jgi:cell shape-determining protein MreC
MRIALALAALVSLSACNLGQPSSAGDVVAKADITIEKVQAGYDQAKAFVELFVPYLSSARVSQIRTIEKRIEAALDLARKAKTVAEQLVHLKDAQSATVELAGAPDDTAAP